MEGIQRDVRIVDFSILNRYHIIQLFYQYTLDNPISDACVNSNELTFDLSDQSVRYTIENEISSLIQMLNSINDEKIILTENDLRILLIDDFTNDLTNDLTNCLTNTCEILTCDSERLPDLIYIRSARLRNNVRNEQLHINFIKYLYKHVENLGETLILNIELRYANG
jgi:hypothetical protein